MGSPGIEKSTGTKLQVVPENSIPDGFNSRILLGITKAALGQGIEPEKMGPDEFIHPLPEFAERVKFLQAGLEHARLAIELMAAIDSVSPPGSKQVPLDHPERLERIRELLRELIEFRRKHEHLYISDYLDASISENRVISNMAELLEDIQ